MNHQGSAWAPAAGAMRPRGFGGALPTLRGATVPVRRVDKDRQAVPTGCWVLVGGYWALVVRSAWARCTLPHPTAGGGAGGADAGEQVGGDRLAKNSRHRRSPLANRASMKDLCVADVLWPNGRGDHCRPHISGTEMLWPACPVTPMSNARSRSPQNHDHPSDY